MVGVAWRDDPGAWRLRRARVIRALVIPVLSVVLIGCAPHKRINPDYCDPAAKINCPPRTVCNPDMYRCIPVVGVGPDGGIDTGPDGATDLRMDSTTPDGATADVAPDGATADVAPDGATADIASDGATADVAPDGPGDGMAPDAMAPDKVPSCPPCTGPTPICDTITGTCTACKTNPQCVAATPMTPLCATNGGACVMCNGDTDCKATKPICDTSTGTCAACKNNNQCAAATPMTPLCATGGGACVMCNGNNDCKATTPICDTSTGTCNACKNNNQCVAATPMTPLCATGGGACVMCNGNNDCKAATPVCDSNHACSRCTENANCAGRVGAPVCRMDNGACVECVAHSDCKSPAKPACGPSNVCVPCTSDQQCVEKLGADPGACMLHTDGHCATATEVLYVRPVAGCLQTGDGAGTVSTPFCQLNNAMPAVSPMKSIVVVRSSGGVIALAPWVYGAPPAVAELTVIGQQGATIGPGTGVGVTLTAGTVYLRGLRISGMLDGGIYVAPGTTLKMNRCFVTDSKGGLFVNGAGFQITNSVFANNGLATIDSPGSPPIEYGGAYLGGLANKLAVFRFNTVYGNMGPGLVCGGTYPVKGLLVAGNTTSQVVTCDFSDNTSEVPGAATVYDPKFDTTDTRNPYRLSRQSTCVNKGGNMSSDSPPDDIDGNPRPASPMTRLDCGASEYQGP